MRTHHPARSPAFDYAGFHRYFLTFCTYGRRPRFVRPEQVDVVLLQILRAAEREHMALLAYCFMPDHAHLLAEGQTEAADGRHFIALAKQPGYHYRSAFRMALWQRYSYERTLRVDEPTLSVARYIIENPVRAGLVTSPAQYPFTGSSVFTMEQMLDALAWTGPRDRSMEGSG